MITAEFVCAMHFSLAYVTRVTYKTGTLHRCAEIDRPADDPVARALLCLDPRVRCRNLTRPIRICRRTEARHVACGMHLAAQGARYLAACARGLLSSMRRDFCLLRRDRSEKTGLMPQGL